MNNKYNNEYARLVSIIEQYFVDSTLPSKEQSERLTEVMHGLQSLKMLLCGGATLSLFTRSSINDLDFYMKEPSNKHDCEAFLNKYFQVDFVSANAITYSRQSSRSRKKWRVQLITRFRGPAEKIFNDFDFTITQSAFDFETSTFEFGDRFFPDVAAKRLVFLGSSFYPICAMYRTKKYQERGYSLPGTTIMHIALSIVRLKIENYGQLKEQLMGIDTMLLQGLLNGPNYREDLPVDYGAFLADVFSEIDGGEYDASQYE